MYRVVVTLLVLLFAHSAWAEWVKYDERPVASSYYDPATVKKGGNMVRVWVFTNLWARVDGQWSRRALLEFDCKEERNRILQQTSFSGPMMSGEIDTEYSFVRAGKWKDILPGSPRATLQSIVCPRRSGSFISRNMDDLEAAGELGEWARRNEVAVDFEKRSIGIGAVQHDVICVLFLTG